MKKALQNKTVYEPNRDVKVSVVNKPAMIDLGNGAKPGFAVEVTVKYKTAQRDELKFATDDDIAEFLGNIDYSEPQLGLGL